MGNLARKIAIAAAAPIVILGGTALATTTASAAPAHVVTPGETLSGIAAENGTSVSNLVSLNNISDPDVIDVGQTINVGSGGSSSPSTPPAVYYQKTAEAPKATPASSSAGSSSSSALDYIAFHESTNNPNAVNPSSGTYGLFQFLPGTGPGAGASVAEQYAAAHSYAVSRYGSDQAAQAFWEANHWW